MAYIITANLVFSSQSNRDAARTRIDAAVAAHNVVNRATALTAGITNPTTTSITISIQTAIEDGDEAAALGRSIYDAAVVSNRHTSGYLSVNRF